MLLTPLGILATIPPKIRSEIPLPMPLSLICSPSHIRNAVPAVNGHHPEVGLNSYVLTNGDRIIWHYTDDYTKEEGSEKWNTQNDEVKNVTTDTKTATTTAPTEVKVSGNTATAKVKAEHSAEIIKQAKENKSFEIILEVSAGNTKGAESVQMQES